LVELPTTTPPKCMPLLKKMLLKVKTNAPENKNSHGNKVEQFFERWITNCTTWK
jgi:hypothetical protein